MENVRNFYYDIDKKIEEDIEFDEFDSKHKYRFLRSIDFEKVLFYRDKIADKLFSINKEDREIYAGHIINEIDSHNFIENLVKMEEEVEEKIDEIDSYKLRSIKNELGENEFVDVSQIVKDNDFFIALVFQLFLSFKINMKDIEKKFELRIDYSRFNDFDENVLKRYEDKKLDNLKNKSNSNITLAQQILAIRKMLTKLGVKYNSANNTALTEFIQFLLNKEVGTLARNSHIYEIVREKKQKTDKKYNKDCDFVAEQFDKISLHDLANELRKSKAKI